jgi:mono/diheme cytochrome c family protein
MKKFLKILGLLSIVAVVVLASGYIYLQVAFPKVSPAADVKVDMSPEKIERGKYLANGFAGCIDCHSTRDYSKFSGPLVPGTEGMGGFDYGEGAGYIPASNITPDKETGIGNWSDGEIFRAITAGVDKDGKMLAPMMPYPVFSTLDKEDLYAIIAYIRTLPPIKNKVAEKKLNFPLNLIFRTLPKDPDSFGKLPEPNDKVKLGEYYAKACRHCHSPGDKGEYFPDKLFSGGVAFPMPDGKLITSSNITPDKATGIGTWTRELFIEKFKMFRNTENIDIAKYGYNTPMPWNIFANVLKDEDLEAVYEYLMTQKPVEKRVEKVGIQGVN